MKKLERLYDRLTPEERFQLALEALGRDDDDEMELLFLTCPKKVYSLPDPAFTDRLKAIHFITIGFCLIWEFAYAGRSIVGGGLSACLSGPKEFPGKEQFEKLWDAESKFAKDLKIGWRGFSAFCQERGLNPEALLKTFFPPVLEQVKHECERWNKQAEFLEQAQRERTEKGGKPLKISNLKGDIESVRNTFAEIWEERVGTPLGGKNERGAGEAGL